MPVVNLLKSFNVAEIVICCTVLVTLIWRRLAGDFPALIAFLGVHIAVETINVSMLFFRQQLGVSRPMAYHIYICTYWPAFILQSALMLAIVYGLYSEALRPFQPLRKLGMIIFRWIAAISLVVAITVAVGPHMFSPNFMGVLVGQTQQFVNILTICMLVFVCFALRPLGITFDSHLFGVSLGLGTMATASLVQAAWLATSAAKSLYSPIYLTGAIGACIAVGIWTGYFCLPEPKRETILLPTTSPYFFWNSISKALGDAPGFVAIAGLRPDMFHADELEAFYQAHPKPLAAPEPKTVMRPVAAAR